MSIQGLLFQAGAGISCITELSSAFRSDRQKIMEIISLCKSVAEFQPFLLFLCKMIAYAALLLGSVRSTRDWDPTTNDQAKQFLCREAEGVGENSALPPSTPRLFLHWKGSGTCNRLARYVERGKEKKRVTFHFSRRQKRSFAPLKYDFSVMLLHLSPPNFMIS